MKRGIILVLLAVLFNFIVGSAIGWVMGCSPLLFGIIGVLIGTLLGGVKKKNDALEAGVLTEIWTGEMVKSLRAGMDGTFLDGVPDSSSIVENDVIHLVDVGVDPDVLINNSTYPIPIQPLPDANISISLDKFQTKVTPITDDELYALSYDKMSRVKESHANSINDSKFTKAAHALCATSNATLTPVLSTTGDVDVISKRKMMSMKDIIYMKKAMDTLKVPTIGRRLVLCSDHVNDLLATEQTFKEQYNINRQEGVIGRLYGFDIYEYANCPYYTTAGVKKAVGATADTGEFQASFAFYIPRTFKATGSTKTYFSEASQDPEHQQNLINFRHYFICMPKKSDAGVVMRSTYVAS